MADGSKRERWSSQHTAERIQSGATRFSWKTRGSMSSSTSGSTSVIGIDTLRGIWSHGFGEAFWKCSTWGSFLRSKLFNRPDLEIAGVDLWATARVRYQIRQIELHVVLLSHAHLDHSGYISFLRQDMPIVSSRCTAYIAKAIQDSSRAA